MKFIDSHAHLDFEDFHEDLDAVIKRAKESGVEKIINIGADIERSRASVFLAEHNPDIFATVGVHPDEAGKVDIEYVREELERLIKSSRRVVGVGECGLDFFRVTDNHQMALQNELFKAQLEIAREHRLPAIIHIRNGSDNQAYLDAKNIIKEVGYYNGVVHCFTFGSREAVELSELGFYIGFTGIITFKNTTEILESVKALPLEKILIETDSPLLAPQKYRGTRNESAYVVEVAQKIAEIKQINIQEVAEKTTSNAKKLFGI